MKCPICNTWTRVLQTRNVKGKENEKRRRYECANLHRFSTLETIFLQINEQQIVSPRKIAPSKN